MPRLSDPYFRCNCDQCNGTAMPPDPYERFSDAELDALEAADNLGQEHEWDGHPEPVQGCPECFPPPPRPNYRDPRMLDVFTDDLPF